MIIRSFFCILVLCFVSSSVWAEDKPIRYGLQTSLNSYTVDDPNGNTARGSGLSVSGIALFDINRDNRMMLNINRDSYSLAGSQTNVGQDVSSVGGGLSYQTMLRFSRLWKPWVGAGLGYTSTTYSNRFLMTPGGYENLYADRKTTDTALLLNADSEWQYNRDWDIGIQAQFAKTISDKSSTLRVGIYIVY